MVKELIHDPLFLAMASEAASEDDRQTAADLLDTLAAHKETCVGMAANMIGARKRIIAFSDNGTYAVMYNPVIIKKEDPYDTEESCLSLLGKPRKCRRYRKIKVSYQTGTGERRVKSYSGFTAQIIQHETDHINGILI